jgi:molybdopterin-containing oxidoreductase family membrane subunit
MATPEKAMRDQVGAFSYGRISRDIIRTLETPGPLFFGFYALILAGLGVGVYSWVQQIRLGMGVSGLMNPVGWGVYITDFVFWVGIAHAGTLISAILFLLRAPFRNAIYRTSEAMTVFAVATAGLFPLIHIGRVWFFYWLIPYPNTLGLWPQFRSPLVWDVFAITTYAIVSILFWYVGLLPDLATMRDRARSRFVQIVYGFLAMGWRGSARHWHRLPALSVRCPVGGTAGTPGTPPPVG